MNSIPSPGRRLTLPGFSRWLVPILRAMLVLASLLLLAYWLTRLFSPGPVAALPETHVTAPNRDAAAMLPVFGLGAASAVVATPGNITLTGIFADRGGRGFATFRLAKGPVAIFQDQEVMPGIRLHAIHNDRVTLDSGGILQDMPLKQARPPGAAVKEDQ